MRMSHGLAPYGTTVEVPDFRGMQALNAWLAGHDAGVLLAGPDPDSPRPLLHGRVARQSPPPGTLLHRWDPVTVWVHDDPEANGRPGSG
jgi:beta-lactam-binding protein with PASTA domain